MAQIGKHLCSTGTRDQVNDDDVDDDDVQEQQEEEACGVCEHLNSGCHSVESANLLNPV